SVPEGAYRRNAAFAPKFLTQADVLTTIDSGLTARSDTFTIRTYGEVVNPATDEITSRAWCEAVVQRLPEYVEDNVNAWDSPAPGSDSQTFGRKFKIISCRWLTPSDISSSPSLSCSAPFRALTRKTKPNHRRTLSGFSPFFPSPTCSTT